ncbi:MAG: efflux RND transporter permease subunit, partial [Myxococcota bacterium]|nr:efflux RND transporter permease subunit [Myxococcota bacterium]
WLFRHPLVVVSPLLVVMLAALNTFGFMAGVGIPITMLSMILPAFIICVGLGDSVHLISVFRSMLGRGLSRREALVFAIGSTGKPIVYTSLTTMIGLLSFRFASIEGIQQMGTAGAIGVCAACLHSLLLLPILLSFLGEDAQLGGHSNQAPDRLSHFLRWCNLCSTSEGDDGRGALPLESRRRRRLTLFLGALLFGALLASMSLLEVYHNPLSWLSEEQPLRRSFALMDEEMGGSADIHLLIEGGEQKGLRDLSLFQGLEALEAHIKTFEHPRYGAIVGPVVSPLNVVKSTVRALNEGDEEAYRLPKDDASLSESLFLFENAGPDEMKRMMTTDLSRGRASLRLRWLDASAYAPVAAHLEAGIREYIPAQVKVRPTGTVYSLLSTIGQLIIDLGKSFGVACFIITVLLIIQLRSVKLGLIAMVPNLTPIIFVMGFMAITGIPIDMVNILIASLAIGIAVDDTIHMLHHFQIHFREHANVEEAIHNAFEHAGRAMVSTSVVLGSGFAAFSFATISNIQRFGLLITLTAVAAMLIDLIFTPALLRLCFAREETGQAVSRIEKSVTQQGEA